MTEGKNKPDEKTAARDLGQIAKEARELLVATADLAGEKINKAGRHLITELEHTKEQLEKKNDRP